MTTTCRVLLVDDEAAPRQAFAQLIGFDKDFEVVATADGAASAMQQLGEARPDVLVADLSMPGPDGIQLTKAVRSFSPDVRVLILSSHDESLFAERALLAGASGYLMKVNAPPLIGDALRKVHAGGIYLSDGIWRQLYREPCTADLSGEEAALLDAIAIGNPPSRALAQVLDAPIGRIEQLTHDLMRKLGLIGHTELRLFAARRAQSR